MAEEEVTPTEETVKAPEEMTDEELKVEADGGQPPAEPEVPAEETPAEDEPEAGEVEEKPISRREALRIQQVIAKAKQGGYTQKPAAEQLDYGQALDADPETIKTLEADRQAAVQAERGNTIRQAEAIQFRTLLEIDAPKVEDKYSFLDAKDTENFKPAVADAINNWYLATAGYDPQTGLVANSNVRYGDFVEGIMELADELAGNKIATTTKNITKQAAQTGIRPDGSQAKRLNLNKAPEQMTDEELKAVIGQAGL